jgi:hypothetical protein
VLDTAVVTEVTEVAMEDTVADMVADMVDIH